MWDKLFVKFSNVVRNDQATVNPPFRYYSQIEGLGLHVVYIAHYVTKIKRHLHNQIEIIEIERQ